MKDNIRNSFFSLLLNQITLFYNNKKDKRGLHSIKYNSKYILNIILDKFITGISWRDIKYLKSNYLNINFTVI